VVSVGPDLSRRRSPLCCRKILGRLGAFIGVGNFVPNNYSDHHVGPWRSCGPDLCQALESCSTFFMPFAAFPQPMVMAGKGHAFGLRRGWDIDFHRG